MCHIRSRSYLSVTSARVDPRYLVICYGGRGRFLFSVCLPPVSCAQCCHCLWIVNSVISKVYLSTNLCIICGDKLCLQWYVITHIFPIHCKVLLPTFKTNKGQSWYNTAIVRIHSAKQLNNNYLQFNNTRQVICSLGALLEVVQ